MHAHPVARAYAEALFAIAKERNTIAEVGQQLEEFSALVRDHADVRMFLETPMLKIQVKKRALEEALHQRVSPLVTDFLCLLLDKERMPALGTIAAAYRFLADEAAGRKRVRASSAVPLSADLQEKLVGLLREKLQADCILETDVRPELLGGLVLTIGDKIFDGSVSGQLQRIGKEMMRSSGYED